jgi:hypothetical protein
MKKEELIVSAKWNIYLLVLDVGGLFLFSLVSGQSAVEILDLRYLPTLLFLEAAIPLLIGSTFELSSSIFFSKIREYVFHSGEKWSIEDYDQGRRRAFPYLLLGIYLLLEAFASSFVLG